jgi:hypothetical protein
MRIEDKIQLTDNIGPKGYVIMKKSDGTVLFEKFNLIVAEGRKYLRELFIVNAFPSDFSYNRQYEDYSLKSFGFGSSGVATELDTDNLEPLIDNNKINIKKEILEALNGQMYIVLKGTLTPESGTVIRELGLFLSNDSNDKLFSRVVFDPIPVEAGETYDIDYYIYF